MPAADTVPRGHRRVGIIAAVVACLVAAIVLISGWPGTSSRPRASATPTGRVRWTYNNDDYFDTRPAVAGGIVYIGGYGGTIYALNAATGSLRWSYLTADSAYSTPEPVDSGPAVAGGTVYIGSDGGMVYALRAP